MARNEGDKGRQFSSALQTTTKRQHSFSRVIVVFRLSTDRGKESVQQYRPSLRGESSLLDELPFADAKLQPRDEKSTEPCHVRRRIPPGFYFLTPFNLRQN